MKKNLIFIISFWIPFVAIAQLTWVDVKTFGPKANGRIDDTEAFEKAIQFCETNGNNGIFVPTGRYLINKQLVIKKAVPIKGSHNSELIIGNGVRNNFLWLYGNANGTAISKIHFNGRDNTSITELIRFDNMQNIEVSFCEITGRLAINFDNVKNIVLKNNIFNGIPDKMDARCNFSRSIKVDIYENTFNSSGGLIFYDNCRNIKIHRNAFNQLTGYPVHFDGLTKEKISEVLINDNKFIGSGAIAFKGGTYDQVSCFGVEKLQISNNTIVKSGDMGITLAHTRDVYVYNNLIAENNVSAISVSNVKNVIIENNRMPNNGIRPTLEGTDPVALGAYYFYVHEARYATDSLLFYNNTITFSSKSKRYHTVGINGTNKNYIKIYFVGKSDLPDEGNYIQRVISNNQYSRWKRTLLSKIEF